MLWVPFVAARAAVLCAFRSGAARCGTRHAVMHVRCSSSEGRAGVHNTWARTVAGGTLLCCAAGSVAWCSNNAPDESAVVAYPACDGNDADEPSSFDVVVSDVHVSCKLMRWVCEFSIKYQ